MSTNDLQKSDLDSLKPDTVIYGGTVYDGTGAPGVAADVALVGDTIIAVASGLKNRYAFAKTVDATGLAVAPGFIDIHTHSDLSVLAVPSMASSIHQGVTTEMAGNCGMAAGLIDAHSDIFEQERGWMQRENIAVDWDRISGFYRRIEENGVGINIATLAGHNTIRKGAMGFADRPPDEQELEVMKRRVAQAMEDGAFGFSTGLEYIPGGFAQLDEIAALAAVSHEAGGFYASHMRSESDLLLESVNETIAVGERTGIPVQISHHKAEGKPNWGKVAQTLPRMQAARDAGYDVMTDQYPYTAFMTGLSVILLPLWARSTSPEEMINLLVDSVTRAKIEAEIPSIGLDFDMIKIGIARAEPQVQGMTLAEIGRERGVSPITAGIDLLIAADGWIGAAHFALSENDVEAILREPHTMIGSDGVAAAPGRDDRPHPRAYGAFPRVLGRYVRERNVISLPEAIRRMTSLPAQRIGLSDRGRIAPGLKADLAVFNPATIADRATFDDPHQFPIGVDCVFVNGTLAVQNGRQTEARAGRVLRKS